ncbi:SAM-dependent methyltransferase [Nocardia testacea]|uniref:SAM-dependent methyltransferase n=1 Tax=Nocardia testacea TaxID=248551 RepID=UPI001FE05F4C|nr:SAM-dependent methyltransferase [Nocardia testacea]
MLDLPRVIPRPLFQEHAMRSSPSFRAPLRPPPDTCLQEPVGVDASRASVARVHDYSLLGKDNYEVDRAVFTRVLEMAPGQREVSRMNRRWMHRVVRYLAGYAGVEQFVDIGAGLPTALNTHEVVQLENRRATVIYVDNDPVCAAYGRALLERNDRTHYVLADFLEAGTLLKNPDVLQYLELDRPIGVLVCGLLHHIGDRSRPARAMRELIERLPSGSYVAVTNFYDPGSEDPEIHRLARKLEEAFTEGVGSGWYRTRTEHLEYFEGLELLPPGLVELDDWWPLGRIERDRLPEERTMRGAVGYKRPALLRFPGA